MNQEKEIVSYCPCGYLRHKETREWEFYKTRDEAHKLYRLSDTVLSKECAKKFMKLEESHLEALADKLQIPNTCGE